MLRRVRNNTDGAMSYSVTRALMLAGLALSSLAFTAAAEARTRSGAGLASWYGPGFHGRRTASGETFNTGALTAAHKSLPFGARVRVVNAKTGRSVVVRINDRGPFIRGRVIDLSKAAARAIGMDGIAPVRLARM
jgi:rare lipoprotein A